MIFKGSVNHDWIFVGNTNNHLKYTDAFFSHNLINKIFNPILNLSSKIQFNFFGVDWCTATQKNTGNALLVFDLKTDVRFCLQIEWNSDE